MEYPKLNEFKVENKTVHFKNYLTFMEMSVIIDNMLKTDNTVLRTYVKWFYFIISMLRLTKLFSASPFSIPFCNSAKSMSCFTTLLSVAKRV